MAKRSKRKSSLIAMDKMRTSSPLSPQKGIQRNSPGYNLYKKNSSSQEKHSSALDQSAQKQRTYRRRKLKRWNRQKGNWDPKKRARVIQQRLEFKLEEKQLRIDEYKQRMKEIETRIKRRRVTSWQASAVFTMLAMMLQWTILGKPFTLLDVAAYVGQLIIFRPCARVVMNNYNSWRLTKSFKPLHRGRQHTSVLDRYPMIKRKAVAWTRRRLVKRKSHEAELTAKLFMEKMNILFAKYNVRDSGGINHLEWSEPTALRCMHRIKLEYGGYSKGYCDGHDRPDVLETLGLYIEKWYGLEPRMHLWIKHVVVDGDNNGDGWRHVDEFRLKGPNSLNRDNLEGSFGGQCKVGIEGHADPSKRPLLTFANDEVIFKTKRNNPRTWKARKQNKLQSKDALGTGRMLSGWAHEYLGFIELTDAELARCNVKRVQRGLPPMKYKHFCLKKFDYGKNREV